MIKHKEKELYTNYSYDALSRVVNVTNPDYTNASVVFNRWNISTFDENNHRKDYVIDAYDRIVAVREYNIDLILNDYVVSVYTTSYGYDAADELVWINDTYGNQFKFTYDSLGRRTRLNDPDIGEINYSYDLAGNLVSQVGGSGNLISGDGFYREYNALNQLTKVRNGSSASSPLLEQYYYDYAGDRIKVWRNDSAKTVIYTPFRELMQVRNSSGVYNYTYVYDGSVLVARVNPDNSKYFYHPDQLGSTTLITDSAGNVVENTFYEPFGDVSSGGTKEVKLYTGQFSDDLTDQYYYGARYYKPSTGKFIQHDKLLPNLYDPQSLNSYSYAKNNPYKYVDINGLVPKTPEMWMKFGASIFQTAGGVLTAVGGYMTIGGSEGQLLPLGQSMIVIGVANFGFGTNNLINSWNNVKSPMDESVFANVGYAINGKKGKEIGKLLDIGSEIAFMRFDSSGELIASGISGTNIYFSARQSELVKNYLLFNGIPNSIPLGDYDKFVTYLKQVDSNANLDNNQKTEIERSIVNSAPNKDVTWYYNNKKGTYQYWSGIGKPSNTDYKPITR